MKRSILIFGFVFSTGFQLLAQQTSLMSHYFLNPYLINPAMTGQSEETKAFFLYRRQWANISGAPETQVFAIDGPINQQHPIGLGLTVTNDVTNVINRFSAMLSSSYKIELTQQQSLAFGMSLGIIQHRLDFEKIRANDPSDIGLLINADSRTALEGTAGLSYSYDKFRLGFAAEQLFNRTITYENSVDAKAVSFALVRHFLLTLQYDLQLTQDLSFTPLILARNAQGLSPEFELNTTFKYQDFIWANLAYRHDIGVGISGGVDINEKFLIGYTYDIPTTDLRAVTGGSHEFTIGLKLGKGSRNSSPASSRSLNNKVIEELKRNDAAQYEKIDELQQSNEQLNQELNDYKTTIEKQSSEIEALKKVVETYDDDLKATINELKVNLQEEKSFDRKSTYYLVVGAFKTTANARIFQKVLQREVDLSTKIVQNDNKTWYFIYTQNLNSSKESYEQIKKIESTAIEKYIIGNPWVYKKNN